MWHGPDDTLQLQCHSSLILTSYYCLEINTGGPVYNIITYSYHIIGWPVICIPVVIYECMYICIWYDKSTGTSYDSQLESILETKEL